MDYEKMYKEALERARLLHGGPDDAEIEEIFPELAESEDERIRRTLMEYFGPSAQLDFIRGVPIKKIRDWLEKQKEESAERVKRAEFLYEDAEKLGERINELGKKLHSDEQKEQKELPFVKDVMLGYPGLYFYDGERMHFQGNPAMEENLKKQDIDFSTNDTSKNDARKRRQIIALLSASKGKCMAAFAKDIDECVAYLIEKQKEPKHDTTDAKSERVIKAARSVLNNWLDGTDCPDVSGAFVELEYAIRKYDGEEKQKENSKSADSIPSDCVSDAKCEDRWHKVKDSLPDNTREVLCKDAIGNYFIGRYYSKGIWEVSMYDDCDKSNEDNPPVVMWCDIPSEKQKEQIPYTDFVIKPHKGDDNNPYDMRVSEAQEYAIKRGFGIPFNDGEVYVDERHMTQTIGNILRWADDHPKEQKPAEWSEEDEKQIAQIERIVKNAGCAKMLQDKIHNWLKSLRPSWKPSEEQEEPEYYQHFDPDC